MLCLKVPKSEGEEVRNKLLERDLLYQRGKIDSDKDHLYIPLNEDMKEKLSGLEYPLVEREVEEREKKERNYRELVDIPEGLKEKLPSSYDVIGDIVLIKLPEELENYRGKIGDALLETHKNVNTILEDRGVHGEFRIREVKHIAGEEKTEAVYREHGAKFEIDVERAYFSPRLGTERWRVVKKVDEGEKVLDMFAGVGPYTVLIGKNVDVSHIYSIDLNPEAIKYLKKNVERNGLEDMVTIFEGDAEEIAPDLSCDRIIMNLPHSSKNFIDSALSAVKERGRLHYYEIIEEEEREESLEELTEMIERKGYESRVDKKREVRTYSATKVQMAYDIEVVEKDQS